MTTNIGFRKCVFYSIASCILLSGCGGSTAGRKPVYKVTGKITMSGGPLVGAVVSFAPQEGQPVAIARTNDAGEYNLTTYDPGDGAVVGSYAVVLSKSAASDAAPAAAAHSADGSAAVPTAAHDSESGSSSKSLIPEKYTIATETPFSATVTAEGVNNFNFDIL